MEVGMGFWCRWRIYLLWQTLGETVTQFAGNGTSNQGFSGGTGGYAASGGFGGSGGGGGAAGLGSANSGCSAPYYGGGNKRGGVGLAVSITGSSTTYGTGGNAINGIGEAILHLNMQILVTVVGVMETSGVNNGGGAGGPGLVVLRMLTENYSR